MTMGGVDMVAAVNRPIIATGLVAGALFGLTVGATYARAQRAWSDYKTTKASVPVLRKAAWALIWLTTTKGGLLTIAVGLVIFWAAVDDN
jgi:hypothetical protein